MCRISRGCFVLKGMTVVLDVLGAPTRPRCPHTSSAQHQRRVAIQETGFGAGRERVAAPAHARPRWVALGSRGRWRLQGPALDSPCGGVSHVGKRCGPRGDGAPDTPGLLALSGRTQLPEDGARLGGQATAHLRVWGAGPPLAGPALRREWLAPAGPATEGAAAHVLDERGR